MWMRELMMEMVAGMQEVLRMSEETDSAVVRLWGNGMPAKRIDDDNDDDDDC
jgi:hypothetical protein